jgi:DNA-binding CsgD family transcriptional regulator
VRIAEFEQHTLRLAAAVVPASRFCVYRVDRDLQPYGHVVLGGDTRWVEPYLREFRQYDPIHPRYFASSTRAVFRLQDAVCTPEQMSRYRLGFQKRMGVSYKAEVFMRDPAGRIVAGLRLSRGDAFSEFDDEAVAKLEALEPVLTGALQTALRDDVLLGMNALLTEREREVLHWVAEGVPNKLICRRLDLALPTVKCHVKKVLQKFGVRSRAELIAKLYRTPLC